MANSLKINVVAIPDEGLNINFSEGARWFEECFPERESIDFNLRKVDVNCQVTKVSTTVFIKGSISVHLDVCCSRCLEDTGMIGNSDFAYTLIPAKPEFKEDVELQAEELEISYYSGDVIDLAPIVCEQIILQVPIKPLCSEECKGLCPRCGINLNIASCNCQAKVVDDRLAVLKNLKIKKN